MIIAIPAAAADRKFQIAFVDLGNAGRSIAAKTLANVAIDNKSLKIQVISRAINLNPYNLAAKKHFVILLRERDVNSAPRTAI